VIHPGQIEVQSRLLPSAAEIAAARRRSARSTAPPATGARRSSSSAMIDEASRRLAEAVLARVWSRAVMDAPLHDIRIVAVDSSRRGRGARCRRSRGRGDQDRVRTSAATSALRAAVPGRHRLALLETFNRNKQSVTLDLRSPEGRAVFEDLVRHSDAVFSNLRGDQPARLGLRYEDLAHVNPRIVCVSLSGFGMTGPRAGEGAYDMTIQGLSGWMAVTGGPDAPPTKSGLSLVDFGAGYVARSGRCPGVAGPAGRGRARRRRVALRDRALAPHLHRHLDGLGTGTRAGCGLGASDDHPLSGVSGADGWLVVACAKEDMWRLLRRDQQPDSLPTSASRASAARPARDALLAICANAVVARSRWIDRRGRERPCGSRQRRRGRSRRRSGGTRLGRRVPHPSLGEVRMVATRSRRARVRRALLGEGTAEILARVCSYDERGSPPWRRRASRRVRPAGEA
jgi:crotonobetainyl-CoA:carnitine CoA-transferase CaiB-like acyl-CoA transferase